MSYRLIRATAKWAVFFVLIAATGLSAASGIIGSGLSFFELFNLLLSLVVKASSLALCAAACLALFTRVRLQPWLASLASLSITLGGSALLSMLLMALFQFFLSVMGVVLGALVVVFCLLCTSFTAFGSLLMIITALSKDYTLGGKAILLSLFADRYRDKKGV